MRYYAVYPTIILFFRLLHSCNIYCGETAKHTIKPIKIFTTWYLHHSSFSNVSCTNHCARFRMGYCQRKS